MKIRKATPSDASGIAKIAVDTWRSAYRGIISDEVLAGLSYEQKEKTWNKTLTIGTDIVFIAENENGDVVGYASGGKERRNHPIFQGELYTLYILESYQRMGIGKQLLISIAQALSELQIWSMFVWVLKENSSRYFYESLGGIEVEEKTIVIGGANLKEIGYGWSNTKDTLLR